VTSSIAAGVVHAAVVPEHLEEAWLFGVFFIAAAVFQISWTIRVVLGPSSAVYSAGALANGAMIGIWFVSRTIGLPTGPEPWMAESAGMLDVAATVLELLLVAGSLVLRARVHEDGLRTADDSRWLQPDAAPSSSRRSREGPQPSPPRSIPERATIGSALRQAVRSPVGEGEERR
jgi:hypothetical protein